MLWSIFGATGKLETLKSIIVPLAWGSDFAAFNRKLAAGEKLSPHDALVARALAYKTAGWSLKSISEGQALLRDYIEFLKESPTVSDPVKAELEDLYTNPAFEHAWDDKKDRDPSDH